MNTLRPADGCSILEIQMANYIINIETAITVTIINADARFCTETCHLYQTSVAVKLERDVHTCDTPGDTSFV